jgi:ADP-ribose pyrophosphatase YjhB (NUDIX family)/rhodanese-related sulfurtransferase
MDYERMPHRRRDINDVLAAAQARLDRLTPAQAAARMRDGWTLVDVRATDLRARDGWIPDSVHAPLNVLEWRVDPESGHPEPALAGRQERLILICHEGFSSSLAAVRLRELGYANTTDVIGGFVAWAAAGLPVHAYSGPVPLGASSVITDGDGRVLLVHHTYGELNWEVPGGVLEPRESAEEAAVREVREETGASIEIERLTGVYWEPGWGAAGGHHFVFRARLAADTPSPTVTDRAEISEVGWFARDALPRPISDFTIRRIDDALGDRPPAIRTVPPRTWHR